MGLMTEPLWDSNRGPGSATNFHLKNVQHLKAMQERARQRQQQQQQQQPHQQQQQLGGQSRQQPLKAFALPESVPPVSGHQGQSSMKNKYGPVQPRLYDWTMNGKGPDPHGLPASHPEVTNGRSTPDLSNAGGGHHHRSGGGGSGSNYNHVQSRVHDWTAVPKDKHGNYLMGHQKTGPFLAAGSSASSVIGLRRQKSSRVPPLGYQDDLDDAAAFHASTTTSMGRFSDVTIEERKLRIRNIVADIYSVQPLCKEHLTRTTIEKNLRRFASCDEVSEMGSTRAGSIHPDGRVATTRSGVSRMGSTAKLNRAGSMISVNYVEPVTSSSRHGNRKPELSTTTAHPRQSGPTDTPRHSALRPMVSKSRLSPRPTSIHRDGSSSPTDRAATVVSRNSRQSRAGSPNFLPAGDDAQSVIARGVDVDYVNANVESVSTVGHHRRQEVQAAIEAANVKKPSMLPPDNYKSGAVPKYLRNRQMEWREEEERREREKPDPDCPPNHIRLSDEVRLDTLAGLRSELETLLAELSRFSVRADSIRIRQRKRDIEEELRQLEAKIKVYERPKVFVLDRH